MAINPELITTIRVDQLPDQTLSLTNLFPHTVGTDLKSATIQELVDLVATSIGVSGGVGYLPISVTDGQQLPDVPESPGFFLCGAGTFLNINGFPNIICTENLNAIMSLTDHWELAVEIPINPLSGSVQSVTGSAVDNTDPLNPVINSTGGGGTQTLSDTLDNGNQTGGTDISISDGDKIVLDNGANLKKGTTDAGLGGTKGIALRCAVDYELKWEAGRLYVMGGDGFTIREVSHNFTTTPTVTDDDDKGFVIDSRWILDNGNVYVCTDATTGAAVWELQDLGTIPTLQQVTDEGNETTNPLKVIDTGNTATQLQSNGILFQDIDDEGSTILRFENTSLTDQEVLIRGLGGTMALLSDITGANPTLQEVLDEGDSAVDSAIFVSNTANDFETSINEFGDGKIAVKSIINDTLTEIGAGTVYIGNVNGTDNVIINKDGISVDSVNYAFPSGSSSPLATLDDITGGGVTQTSQLTNDGEDGVNPFITALDIPSGGSASTLVREVKNMTGATLTKGTVVFISGANGNKALVSKAIATTDALSARTFGLLQSNINNNGTGNCVIIGDLSGLDTSSFAEGAQLYLSGVTAGAFTDTRVLAPTHLVYVGKVTRSHPTQGQIEVQIQNGYELAEIHDVQIITPLDNQVLTYESSTDLWKNKNLNQIVSERRNANNSSNNNINYCGTAPNGSAEATAVWTIKRLTIAASGSITTATATNVAWTNRESVTY